MIILILLIFIYKFILVLLIVVEILILILSIIIFIIYRIYNLEVYIIYYLVFRVCEGVLGLSLLVIIVRIFGNELYYSYNIRKF